MQVLFMALLAFFLVIGVLEFQRTDFFSSQNIHKVQAHRVADNLFAYASTAKEFADANSNLSNYVISNNDLANYSAAQFNALGDYTAVIVTNNDSKYLLISWNTTLSSPAINDIAGNVLKLSLMRKSYGNNTYWQVPVFIVNNGCNGTIINNFAQNIDGNSATLFATLCNISVNQLGHVPGKYVLLEQVIGN